jgi:hypothetical protein
LFIFTEAEGMDVWGDVIGEAYIRKRVLDRSVIDWRLMEILGRKLDLL